ncbi:MAG: helix-turn-helix domain-containing protein [Candidatus Scalindua rubra]|uniref:Helix-turn-helix domain protein n=1 Tax=Candidatus Scalindua brodae TaxID=237368 RepID=A0A0B0ER40_9BACT|nr:MAG: Helix-turn-helix domain protein [Candidatus Scalindua brodae]MBZ0107861.1 helix-turn-helix domain-containing protein [Candidatus Scalindua rubra]TWU29175.1 Helix-turn-helix domain protein [Candidatus Brocadiaceae bacterium S225]
MKAELNLNSDELVARITQEVVKQLKPLLNDHDNGNELMTVEEVANYLKVKPSWVYEKIHTRKIPFQKAGRFPRFRKKHIDKWLENPYSFSSSAYRPLKKEGEHV